MMNNGFIATLWLQLTDIYGARFTNLYGDKDTGIWFQALCDLTEEDIKMGLYAMIRDERFETWPPNCTQLRHLCLLHHKKTLDELPNVHQAFKEARHNLYFSKSFWSHPAIKFTVKHLGVEVVNSARADIAFAQFSALYAKVCERIAQGFELPHVSNDEVVIKRKTTQNNIPILSQLIKVNS